MRGVTLKELTDWVEKNKHHTWMFENFDPNKKASLSIKYLRFSLDTRDMHVWSLEASGPGDNFSVRDDNDGGDRTILDALDDWLKAE